MKTILFIITIIFATQILQAQEYYKVEYEYDKVGQLDNAKFNKGSTELWVQDENRNITDYNKAYMQPNLKVVSVWTVPKAKTGSSTKLTAKIKNIGTMAVDEHWANVYIIPVTVKKRGGTPPIEIYNPQIPAIKTDSTTDIDISNLRFDGVTPGVYNLVFSDSLKEDANNADNTYSLQITIYACSTLSAKAETTPDLCGVSQGSITINATGGNQPYTYEFLNKPAQSVANGNKLEIVPAYNNYQVLVRDLFGCEKQLNYINVQGTSRMLFSNEVVTDDICGKNEGSISSFNVTGGSNNYLYVWDDTLVTKYRTNLAAGNYRLKVVDVNNKNCSIEKSFLINGSVPLKANAIEYNSDTTIAQVVAQGGTEPYTYKWSTGETSQSITVVKGNNYWVEITDNNQCTTKQTVSLSINTLDASTINIYPNPSQGNITIKSVYQIQNIKICDISGKQVAEYLPKNQNSFEINEQNMIDGFYMISVEVLKDNKPYLITKKIEIKK